MAYRLGDRKRRGIVTGYAQRGIRFEDRFNRADTAPNSPAAPGNWGPLWAIGGGTTYGIWYVSSGRGVVQTDVFNQSWTEENFVGSGVFRAADRYFVRATFRAASGTLNGKIGIFGNGNGAGLHDVAVIRRSAGTEYLNFDGSGVGAVSILGQRTIVAGDVIELRFIGAVQTIWLNGSLWLTTTVVRRALAYVGFKSVCMTGGQQFAVTWDDFQAGYL